MPQDFPAADQLPIVTDNVALQNWINSLGLQGLVPPLRGLPFVLPVAVVANPVPLSAQVGIGAIYSPGDIFSAGKQGAPAGNVVLADTGQISADATLDLVIHFAMNGTDPGNEKYEVDVQHRDAANAANVATLRVFTGNSKDGPAIFVITYNVLTGERIRVINLLAGAAGTQYSSTIWARARV